MLYLTPVFEAPFCRKKSKSLYPNVHANKTRVIYLYWAQLGKIVHYRLYCAKLKRKMFLFPFRELFLLEKTYGRFENYIYIWEKPKLIIFDHNIFWSSQRNFVYASMYVLNIMFSVLYKCKSKIFWQYYWKRLNECVKVLQNQVTCCPCLA